MNIIIIGSTGYLGSYLVRRFEELKYNVVCVKHSNTTNVSSYIDENSVIIYCAGLAHSNKSSKFLDYYQSNYLYLTQFLNNIKKSNFKKFYYISTIKVYSEIILDNQNVPSLYSLSKYLAENKVKTFFEKTNFMIIRPSLIYGGDKPKGNIRILEIIKKCRLPLFLSNRIRNKYLTSIELIFNTINSTINVGEKTTINLVDKNMYSLYNAIKIIANVQPIILNDYISSILENNEHYRNFLNRISDDFEL